MHVLQTYPYTNIGNLVLFCGKRRSRSPTGFLAPSSSLAKRAQAIPGSPSVCVGNNRVELLPTPLQGAAQTPTPIVHCNCTYNLSQMLSIFVTEFVWEPVESNHPSCGLLDLQSSAYLSSKTPKFHNVKYIIQKGYILLKIFNIIM